MNSKLMMRMKRMPKYLIQLVFWMFLFSSCHVKKHLPEGEVLYTGTDIRLKPEGEIKGKKRLNHELQGLLRPQPNSTIFGIRLRLWLHYRGSREKAGFLSRYLKRKLGEEPVLLSHLQTERTINLIQNRLENRGYFVPVIEYEIKEKGHKAKIHYDIKLPPAYHLGQYYVSLDSGELQLLVSQSLSNTLIEEGTRYDLDLMKRERERIEQFLKNNGYYNFLADYLFFKVDTNVSGIRKYNLYLTVKPDVPEDALIPYKIHNIKIYPDYGLSGNRETLADTTILNGMAFIQSQPSYKPKHLVDYVLIEPGGLYSQRHQNLTANRLSAMGNFRYVNVRFRQVKQDSLNMNGHGLLDTEIFLSPLNKQAIRAETQLVTKSNNFAGPALLLSYRNRNMFRGGEILSLSGNFSFESQFSGRRQTGLHSYGAGIQADFIIPRVVAPFRVKAMTSISVPKTKISLSFDLLNRVQYYRLNSILATYGYQWNANRFVYHEIHPLSLNYVKLMHTTTEFEVILNSNPFLRQSFEQQFIAGLIYTYQFSQLVDRDKSSQFFLRLTSDFSGNTFNLLEEIINEKKGLFLGQPYAHYAKVDGDIRFYQKTGRDSKIITRLFAGAGFTFGNTMSLPFIKQYYSGGPNSLRAFSIRSVGPGLYRPEEEVSTSFFDRAGDIKFEANVEYRFPFNNFLKGAFFIDAGNIWLMNENPALPGGAFSSEWRNQLAVGGGFGIRLDISFFVLRLDLATPLRKPFLSDGEHWETNFDFSSRTWRREGLVWNFAIGYPF